ncbi:transglutaminase domain-containing protein [Chitinophagaceae bacterium MMS25-I14]
MKYLLACALLLSGFSSFALDSNDFKTVDSMVGTVGPLKDAPLFTIVEKITPVSVTNTDIFRARAIYDWITTNIAFDCEGYHHASKRKTNVGEILQSRVATSEGYAMLFQAMCQRVKIKCDLVKGYEKSDAKAIGKNEKKINYTWNVVEIDGTKYIVDATAGAGYTDYKKHEFTAQQTDVYFFARRKVYVLNHIPAARKWQLLDTPVSKARMNTGYIAPAGYFAADVYNTSYNKGLIRAKKNECKRISIDLRNNKQPVKEVTVQYKDEPKLLPVDYYVAGERVYMDIPLKEKGKYPVKIYVNNIQVLAYKADVKKAKKR